MKVKCKRCGAPCMFHTIICSRCEFSLEFDVPDEPHLISSTTKYSNKLEAGFARIFASEQPDKYHQHWS